MTARKVYDRIRWEADVTIQDEANARIGWMAHEKIWREPDERMLQAAEERATQ